MFQAQVADFYRGKGYTVREKPRVRGASANIYAVDLVAEGPLGALLVSFGDAGGIDIHEVSRVKTLARDVGATPVLAAPAFTNEVRRAAAHMGVVLVDEGSMDDPMASVDQIPPGIAAAESVQRDISAHPWPASGRARNAPPSELGDEVKALEIDDLVADLTRKPAAAPAPAPNAAAGSLWRQTRPMGSPSPSLVTEAAPATSTAEARADSTSAGTKGAFAWLPAKPAPVPPPPPEPILVEGGEHADEILARPRARMTVEPVTKRRVPRWLVWTAAVVVVIVLLIIVL